MVRNFLSALLSEKRKRTLKAQVQRVKTKLESFSIHHVAPEVFGGYDETERGAKLATAEKALFDFAYLSGGRSRLFASLPW